ncbi:MAG: hypothetical protein GKR94_06745 [Gammaproteobacteria bacterium]|nr:hypothetical protein [Gammaproteobacteria bacterium]
MEKDALVRAKVQEIDVFLAYERFSDVERLIEVAFDQYPDAPSIQLKQLELYHLKGEPERFFNVLHALENNPAAQGYLI